MKILVLGASGQIGRVVYDGLKKSFEVTGTSRRSSGEFVQFDPFLDDWSKLGKQEVLINCVGQIQETTAGSFHHIHVELTKQIVSNRAKLGNPRLIQISALGASPEHAVEFLKTKGIADEILLQYPNTAVIRPSIVCTHQTMVVKKIIMLSGMSRYMMGVLPVPKGFLQTRIQPIMPDDLVDLVKRVCIDDEINLLNAVGPEIITFGELVKLVSEKRNRNIITVEISRSLSDAVVLKFVSRLMPQTINPQQYQLLFQDNVADVSICRRMLGRNLASTREFLKTSLLISMNSDEFFEEQWKYTNHDGCHS